MPEKTTGLQAPVGRHNTRLLTGSLSLVARRTEVLVVRLASMAIAVAVGVWIPAPAWGQERLILPTVKVPPRAAGHGALDFAGVGKNRTGRDPTRVGSRFTHPISVADVELVPGPERRLHPLSVLDPAAGVRPSRGSRSRGSHRRARRFCLDSTSISTSRFRPAYTRPVRYVSYVNVNGTGVTKTVWMAFGEFALRGRLPIDDRVSAYGEAGLGLTSRRGFSIGGRGRRQRSRDTPRSSSAPASISPQSSVGPRRRRHACPRQPRR